jgi:hypothetical protein
MVRGRQRARPQPTRTQSARGGRTTEPRLRASAGETVGGVCWQMSLPLSTARGSRSGRRAIFQDVETQGQTSAIRQARRSYNAAAPSN